jgi:hypothetical protein
MAKGTAKALTASTTVGILTRFRSVAQRRSALRSPATIRSCCPSEFWESTAAASRDPRSAEPQSTPWLLSGSNPMISAHPNTVNPTTIRAALMGAGCHFPTNRAARSQTINRPDPAKFTRPRLNR